MNMSEEMMNSTGFEEAVNAPMYEQEAEFAPVLSMPENKKCIEKELKIYKKGSAELVKAKKVLDKAEAKYTKKPKAKNEQAFFEAQAAFDRGLVAYNESLEKLRTLAGAVDEQYRELIETAPKARIERKYQKKRDKYLYEVDTAVYKIDKKYVNKIELPEIEEEPVYEEEEIVDVPEVA